MAGTYYSPSAPTTSEGYFLQPETRVMVGTLYAWGSLEVTSFSYSSYTASIGLQAGKGIDLGELASISFSHVPTFSPVESANIRTSSIYILEGEETMASVGLREFKPDLIYMALGTGTQYPLETGTERVITFGDKCDMVTRPLTLEFSDVSCQVPDAADITAGLSGGIITLYDTFVSSGLSLDDMNAGSLNEITLEFTVRPIVALARGNRLGNIYLW